MALNQWEILRMYQICFSFGMNHSARENTVGHQNIYWARYSGSSEKLNQENILVSPQFSFARWVILVIISSSRNYLRRRFSILFFITICSSFYLLDRVKTIILRCKFIKTIKQFPCPVFSLNYTCFFHTGYSNYEFKKRKINLRSENIKAFKRFEGDTPGLTSLGDRWILNKWGNIVCT